jgi:hypothetical protein
MRRHERARRGESRPSLWGLGVLLCLGWAQAGTAETADCILALVDDSPITLSDIRILDAFGLVPLKTPGSKSERLRAILEEIIGQKVVIDRARGSIAVPPDRVEAALDDLRRRLTPDEFEAKLAFWGLSPDDLKPYVEDQIVFQEIINLRFGRSVAVTLDEIESFYEGTYVPDQKKKGLSPAPLLQVLAELESTVRNEKIGGQVESWIRSLRGQAEVILKGECLKIFKEE